ncbi:MAG: hypothetical protein ACXW27_15035 [Allosphingosinicella sp.]
MTTVFVTTRFEKRLNSWSEEDQKHVFAFQLAIEGIGWDALLSYPFCQIQTVYIGPSGDIERVDFWLKVRMDYVRLTLERRLPEVFVLHD